MRSIGMTEARDRFRELVDQAQFKDEHTEITRYGTAAAVIVSAQWYEAHKGDEDTSVHKRGSLRPNESGE